ncbi:UDP-2,3-diacylglucosamine diphosphatase [Leptospira wolffii]|uniref:UDP-2,3-diacylglucosamine diphosphatase n=1 Tax=Leptospira wolffii TaxID=409998 RepID=UPI001083CA3B|nr:UDP-2,3-diacylglucosamine diphosphatase [Leptospira wolffii]TGK59450.1 UDP-2,3-diacylglucosamine diphosphatase [Leptospira wolffii]TGK71167.1 UDP-2,3-diacylglucosamine diphosphatase [Leptospira wolffii]TGK77735.1 UDP-2,3-diacylglucosamine diphosphatase [Leptospira wolffii]TGL29555.1 UDP-2,3-diacylglucosamine diphosphatase [Leptospira wolffii]
MKFRRGRIYEGFFISDIHYLLNKKIKTHKHKELFQLLDHLDRKNIRFENLYLVGDIIESWFFSADRRLRRVKGKKRFNKLFDRLDKLSAGTGSGKKYYIVGNHDTTSYLMRLSPNVENYLRERNWIVCEKAENDVLIALHGHQGQYNKFTWMGSILVLRILHVFASIFPALFKFSENFYQNHLNRQDPSTIEETLHYYQRLSKITHQGKKVLISGHTHDFLCIPKINIINTGDWVKSNTFVIQNGRKFLGIKMTARKEFKKEFVIKT